ncbi:MAG: hypothetical protein SFU86_18620 [Pirellulaceae bacterium]|nr:hypothetical protein [Pirellulaceae bacterium]
MSKPSVSHWIAGLLAAAVLIAVGGCATAKLRLSKFSPPPEVSKERVARHEEAIQSFEQHRDNAQLQAALDRWQQNDLGGCEARLRALFARRPDFVEARLRLAELAWSCDDLAEAQQQYEAAAKLAPDRADIAHALGLVHEAQGDAEQSQIQLARARELAPSDERYR